MDAKTLCLGVLVSGDASGYEIRKQFEEGPFAYFHETSFGSIYPALTKLLDEGLATCTAVSQAGRPDKKVYAITEQGRATFIKAIHKQPAWDKIRSESMYMMFFADLLNPAHLAQVYDAYLDGYRSQVAKLEAVEKALADPENSEALLAEIFTDAMPLCCDLSRAEENQRAFTRGLGLSLYKTIVAYLEENRSLLMADDADAARAGDRS